MKNKQKKIPKDWQIKKVKDVFDFIGTYSHSKEKMNFQDPDNNSVFNIHYGDIHTKYSTYIDFSKTKVPFLKDSDEEINSDKFLRNGDLVIADASEDYTGVCDSVELVNLRKRKCISGLHTFALRDKSKHTSNGYRALLFKNPDVHNWLMRVSTYSKVYGVTKSSLEKTELLLPPLPEQNRIVAVLETWDESIEKLKKKIEIKKQIKKGLMQDLLTGKKRLPGFSGVWKEVQLGDISIVNMGQSPESENYNEKGAGVVLVQGNADLKNSKTIARIYTTKITKTADYGDIIFTVRAPVGAVGYVEQEKVCLGRGVCSIKAKDSCLDFIFYKLNHHKNGFLRFEQGSTFFAINGKDIRNFKMKAPDQKEQSTIASILITSDKEINLLKSKLKYLEEQKKYLLNNLITGEIRTPENLLEKVK